MTALEAVLDFTGRSRLTLPHSESDVCNAGRQ